MILSSPHAGVRANTRRRSGVSDPHPVEVAHGELGPGDGVPDLPRGRPDEELVDLTVFMVAVEVVLMLRQLCQRLPGLEQGLEPAEHVHPALAADARRVFGAPSSRSWVTVSWQVPSSCGSISQVTRLSLSSASSSS